MRVEPAASLVGHVVVPGDKSISHRAILIGALCEGETAVHGFGRSGDTQATVDAMRSLGVTVEDVADDELVVRGVAEADRERLDRLCHLVRHCGDDGT